MFCVWKPGSNILIFDWVCVERSKNCVESRHMHTYLPCNCMFSRVPGIGDQKSHSHGSTLHNWKKCLTYTVTVLHLACHLRLGKLHSRPKIQQKDHRPKMEHHLEKKNRFRKRIPNWKEFLPSLQVWYMHFYLSIVTRQSQIKYQSTHE